MRAPAQFESLDAPLGACHAQVDLALTLRYEGKLPAALNAYRHALRYQRDYRFTTESADILDGLAAIAAAVSRLDLAARLCGAASGWRETYQEELVVPDAQRLLTSRPPASAVALASKPGSRRTRPGRG